MAQGISCSNNKTNTESNDSQLVLARVYNQKLFYSDIAEAIRPGLPKEDSVLMIRTMVDSWVKKQTLLYLAEKSNLDEELDIEKRLLEYKNSLLIHSYQSAYVRSKLDTSVSENEIEEHYKTNADNFELKENILKVNFIKIAKDAPKQNKLKQWFQSKSDKDKKLLEEYCIQFAGDFYLDDSTWISMDELLRRVPIETYDKENFLRYNRSIETNDSSYLYFVKILDFKIKESISPLSFVKDDIRNLIVNKRKLSILRAMEEEIFEKALQENEVEIFE
ncbi:MAG TPA: peptidyl-prolyl cis-trans isomerase [Bacteroidia bacterium]|nr:peptidyl-prolyl cis-trans isomerase [Bacteroidia bacterium]